MITAAHHFLLQYVTVSAITPHEQGDWLKEHWERFLSLCLPPVSHPLKWHCPYFYEKIYSSSSRAEQTVLNEIWFCPSFIRVVNFLGDRLLSIMPFWEEPDPKGIHPRHGCAAPTCLNMGLHVWWAKNIEENTPWCFFLHSTGTSFLHL